MLDWVAEKWPTPAVTDSFGARNRTSGRSNPDSAHHGGVTLNDAIILWSTPRASDGEKGGPNQSFGAGGIPLPSQASHWVTPRASENNESWETKQARNARHLATSKSSSRTKGVGGPTTTMQAVGLASILPAPVTSTDGDPSSKERRSLNPLFVEWLMGWPPGWVRVSTSCGCSATALCRWKQRMRSALLSLGSPLEALPVQFSLLLVE